MDPSDVDLRTTERYCPDFDFEKVEIDKSKIIGKGSYGNIYIGRMNDKYYAVKIIDKRKITESDLSSIKYEGNIAMNISHPNIIKSYCFIETPSELRLYMDYIPGGDLYDYVDQHMLSECEVFELFDQMVDAVRYLHEKGIVHSDIKLENFLVDDGHIYLIDFGFSFYRKHDDPLSTIYAGTAFYASPELLFNNPNTGYSNDIWALGVSLYIMFNNKYPFHTKVGKRNKFDPDLVAIGYLKQEEMDYDFYYFLKELLNPNDKTRLNIDQVKNHPWMNKWRDFLVDNTCEDAIIPGYEEETYYTDEDEFEGGY